ncbi:nitroreductase [Gordonia sp. HY442]|uniref:nitroreductase n=1 Tax=Gordonia zhenghanii TaxID=2911516 RepID=UPI001F1E9275|nr:nitroreductase [Gordonia zhenghanii]MCF8602069.1 nitroreductase [Gordonia zhenghanii]
MTSNSDDSTTAVLDELLATRWSCRAFLPDPVPRDEIERVLDVARRTPSWCNTQPWHLHVTSGRQTDDLRAALAAEIAEGPSERPDLPFPDSYDGVYRDRRRASGWQLYESLAIDKGDRAASAQQTLRNFDFFDAPHVAILTTDRGLGTYGAVDCGLFVNNFLLAAHSRGIASIPQAALATQAPTLRTFFDLPEDRLIVVGISFGYADPDHVVNSYRTDRCAVADVATFVG